MHSPSRRRATTPLSLASTILALALSGPVPLARAAPGPDHEHEDIDTIPTLREEAEMLRRVEEERLGVNPRTDAGSSSSGGASSDGARVEASPSIASLALASGDPAAIGRWEPLQDWPVIAVFTSLLPDGRVLTFDSVGDAPAESTNDHGFTRASIWDPVTNEHVRVDSDTGYNLFCAGFATLPDGRLFIAGGNANAALDGIVETHTFNPLSDTWARGQRMDFARWYPSVTPLPNGDMLITGGGFAVSEVRESDGAIRRLTTATSSLWDNRNYPWLQTAPDGRVAFLGPDPQLGYVETDGTGSFGTSVQREVSDRNYGSYVLYDIGKVLVAGGGFQSSRTDQSAARLIDLADDSVTVGASMNNRRRQHNLTVLADGSVLATGGFASNAGLVDLANSVFEAELWEPATGQWTRLAEEDRARHYHSSALLLPDGRVLSAGGGICGDCQRDGYLQKNGQVFTPPYLFANDGSGALAERPVIGSAPAELTYDRSISVTTPDAASIVKVGLVRIGSVTHSQNMEQRYVPLSFSLGGGTLSVQTPRNANIAPPGHYMLFIVDGNGVPSVADIVRLSLSLDPPPAPLDALDVAMAGTATQSSTAGGAEAHRAIDGVTDGDAANGSVSMTATENQPWWEVDLGEVHDIDQIVVNRRSDCCGERLANFHVLVSTSPFASTGLSDTLAQPAVGDFHVPASAPESRIDIGRPGRYVRVQLAGRQALELAEVQVLATGGGQGVACGAPRLDAAVDAGVFFWKECDGGRWSLMLTGPSELSSVKAVGRITSELGLIDVTPRSLEASDTLLTSDEGRIDFALTTGNPWSDRFDLTTPEGGELCLGLDEVSPGQQLFVGPFRVPAGTGPVNPETLESCEFSGPDCSAPAFDPRSDKALLSWVGCDGVLHLLGTGALDSARYNGHVHTSVPFAGIATQSFESSDTLTSLGELDLYFDMGMGGGYADEILLTPADDAELCIEITGQSADTVLLAGASRTPVTSPFDPRTLAPCVPPTGGDDCGDPQVDGTSDSALFVWKNCDGVWSVALTGVRPDGGSVSVAGSITSSAGFGTITPRGIESSDSLSTSPISPLTFYMGTQSPWKDGFDFEVPEGAGLCVTLSDVSAGLDLLAGPDRTPVGTSFDPVTYSACP